MGGVIAVTQDMPNDGGADEACAPVTMMRTKIRESLHIAYPGCQRPNGAPFRVATLTLRRIRTYPSTLTRPAGGHPCRKAPHRPRRRATRCQAPDRSSASHGHAPWNKRHRPCRGLRIGLERAETVRDPAGMKICFPLSAERTTLILLSEGRRAFADIDDHVQDTAADNAHQLGLRKRRQLEMRSAYHAVLRDSE